MKKFDKLVRDNIPSILKGKGVVANTHIADNEEYREKLHKKLLEEVEEFILDSNEEELADVYEVIDAIIREHSFSKEEIRKIQERKREEKGGFKKKIILESTD